MMKEQFEEIWSKVVREGERSEGNIYLHPYVIESYNRNGLEESGVLSLNGRILGSPSFGDEPAGC
jgi:hypothetical protein